MASSPRKKPPEHDVLVIGKRKYLITERGHGFIKFVPALDSPVSFTAYLRNPDPPTDRAS